MEFKERLMRLRNFQSQDFWAMIFARPLTILFLLPIINKSWVTPNRLTVLSVIAKLVGIAHIALDMSYMGGVIGAIFINLGLILDNMDGTVARFRNCGTKFGFYLDKATDAITLVLLFWAMGYRAYHFTQELIDLLLPMIGVMGAFTAGYAKWVGERVLLDMTISEKFHNKELEGWAAKAERGYVWSPPPKRNAADWLKWFGKAIFSILYFNEVDIFFWAALALITQQWWIFTRFESGFVTLGLLVGPALFAVKIWRREREMEKMKARVADPKNQTPAL